MIGKSILHYKILEKLGEGGMGIVYLAEDTKLKRQVAIKFLPHHIAANSDERKRFEIEAQAAAALNHPNIATIFAIEEVENETFLVMEYISGKHLKDYVGARHVVPLREAIDIAFQIAEGLQAAHEKGIVHRDIKSSNIMVTDKGKIKIMDFGLAKFRGSAQLTQIGTTVGTAAYMSPEQARGEEADQRADIWSYGVVLCEMLSGQLPFPGDYEQAVVYSIFNEAPHIPHDIPEFLQQILIKTLEKDANNRYQNATEVLNDLKSFADGDVSAHKKRNSNSKPNQKKKYLPGLAIIAVLILIASVFFFLNSNHSTNSIAVLPFENVSNDPENEYLSDGITESIINNLSRLSKLQVKARSIVFRFKNDKRDPQLLGENLNVAAIMTGRVIQQGSDINIQTELLDVNSGSQLWGKKYQLKVTDLLTVQEEISREISERLLTDFSGEDNRELNRGHTKNNEAYQLYLQGRYYWNKRSPQGLEKSLEFFNQAIAIDPNYALAYAGLSDANLITAVYGLVPPVERFTLAKIYAEKSLSLDNKLAETYASLGDINIHFDWDVNAAEINFKKAIKLNPNYASSYHWYSEVYVLRGEFEKGYQQSLRAIELDPYSPIYSTQLGLHYQRAGEYKKSIDILKKTIELDSTFYVAYEDLGFVFLALKQYKKALSSLHKADNLTPDNSGILSLLCFAEAAAGNIKEALHIEQTLLKRAEKEYIPAYDLAVVALALGKKEQGLEYLKEAFIERNAWIPFIKYDPVFDSIRSEKEYISLVKNLDFTP